MCFQETSVLGNLHFTISEISPIIILIAAVQWHYPQSLSSIIILIAAVRWPTQKEGFSSTGTEPSSGAKNCHFSLCPWCKKGSLLGGIVAKLWISSLAQLPIALVRAFETIPPGRLPLEECLLSIKQSYPGTSLTICAMSGSSCPIISRCGLRSTLSGFQSTLPGFQSTLPSFQSMLTGFQNTLLSKYSSQQSPLSSDNVPSFIKRYQINERICLKLTPLKL